MWLIPVLLTVHNVEEAVAFARMRSHLSSVLPVWLEVREARLSFAGLLYALAIVSVLAFIPAGVVILRPNVRAAMWLLLSLETAMAINVFAHVASAIAFFHGYGPGLASAVFINAPFAAYVLARAKREEWVGRRAWQMLGVGGLVLHGPVLMGIVWFVALRQH